jgi:hypothetical protein
MRQSDCEDLTVDELRNIYSAQDPFVTSPTLDYAACRIDRLERVFRQLERQIPESIRAEGRLKLWPEVTDADDPGDGTFSSHGGRVLHSGDRNHVSDLLADYGRIRLSDRRVSRSPNHQAPLGQDGGSERLATNSTVHRTLGQI